MGFRSKKDLYSQLPQELKDKVVGDLSVADVNNLTTIYTEDFSSNDNPVLLVRTTGDTFEVNRIDIDTPAHDTSYHNHWDPKCYYCDVDDWPDHQHYDNIATKLKAVSVDKPMTCCDVFDLADRTFMMTPFLRLMNSKMLRLKDAVFPTTALGSFNGYGVTFATNHGVSEEGLDGCNSGRHVTVGALTDSWMMYDDISEIIAETLIPRCSNDRGGTVRVYDPESFFAKRTAEDGILSFDEACEEIRREVLQKGKRDRWIIHPSASDRAMSAEDRWSATESYINDHLIFKRPEEVASDPHACRLAARIEAMKRQWGEQTGIGTRGWGAEIRRYALRD